MRAAVVVGALALAAAPAHAAATVSPTLRLASLSPFTVRGQNFKPRENVLVTVNAGRHRAERHVRTSSRGSFVTAFPTIKVDRCTGYVARAIGARGSVATLRSPPLLCPPRPSIP